MKKICIFLIFCLIYISSSARAGEWVWIHGSKAPDNPGNHGTQGAASLTNEPPALYEPCEWTDKNGNFWMYGGLDQNLGVHNDLWKYDPVTNEWTWMNGTNTLNDPGVYGTQGVASPTNRPSARSFAPASWVDLKGNLWMFGGYNTIAGLYNDLWKYDPTINEWTWMKGPAISNQNGVYGTIGVADTANVPGSRDEGAAAWTDNAGDL
jgi:hypothetical protein